MGWSLLTLDSACLRTIFRHTKQLCVEKITESQTLGYFNTASEHPKQRKQDRRMSAHTLAQADCKHRPFCCLKDWMDPEWCTMVAGICFFAPRAKNSAAGAPRQLRSWKRTSRLRRCPCSSFTLPRDLGSDAQIQHLSKPRELQHPGLSSWQLAVMEFRVRETPFTPRREKVSAPADVTRHLKRWANGERQGNYGEMNGCLRHAAGFALTGTSRSCVTPTTAC